MSEHSNIISYTQNQRQQNGNVDEKGNQLDFLTAERRFEWFDADH